MSRRDIPDQRGAASVAADSEATLRALRASLTDQHHALLGARAAVDRALTLLQGHMMLIDRAVGNGPAPRQGDDK